MPRQNLGEVLRESQKRRRTTKADRRRRDLRDELWPGSADWIWDINDSEVVGFATVSRLMPLVMHLIKLLGGDKGGEPSSVYLELWCRDFGQGIIHVTDPSDCAYAAGYGSSRGPRTWKQHILKLIDMGFIKMKADGSREFGQILLLNPLAVCAKLRDEGKAPDDWWTAFVRRAGEIGATIPKPPIRFEAPPPPPPPPMAPRMPAPKAAK